MIMNSFTKLQAWQEAYELSMQIYKLSKSFPKEERFGLTDQIRRASISIVANIAEGFSRRSSADKTHKYVIARGECSEVLAFLFVAKGLNLAPEKEIKYAMQQAGTTGKLITGLIRSHSKLIPTSNTQRPTPLSITKNYGHKT